MSHAIASASPLDNLAPSPRQLWHLVIGGFAATGFYEIWANWPTELATGYPLEPPQLVKALLLKQLGVELPYVWAKALHYLTGALFYPIGYWLTSRVVLRRGHPVDGWVWGVVTYFIALGFFAPLAGFPFLLIGENIGLSIMSLIGHAIYGYVLGLVFEACEAAPGGRKS